MSWSSPPPPGASLATSFPAQSGGSSMSGLGVYQLKFIVQDVPNLVNLNGTTCAADGSKCPKTCRLKFSNPQLDLYLSRCAFRESFRSSRDVSELVKLQGIKCGSDVTKHLRTCRLKLANPRSSPKSCHGAFGEIHSKPQLKETGIGLYRTHFQGGGGKNIESHHKIFLSKADDDLSRQDKEESQRLKLDEFGHNIHSWKQLKGNGEEFHFDTDWSQACHVDWVIASYCPKFRIGKCCPDTSSLDLKRARLNNGWCRSFPLKTDYPKDNEDCVEHFEPHCRGCPDARIEHHVVHSQRIARDSPELKHEIQVSYDGYGIFGDDDDDYGVVLHHGNYSISCLFCGFFRDGVRDDSDGYSVRDDSDGHSFLHDNGYLAIFGGAEPTEHPNYEPTVLSIAACGDSVHYSFLPDDGYPDILDGICGDSDGYIFLPDEDGGEKLTQHPDYETTGLSVEACRDSVGGYSFFPDDGYPNILEGEKLFTQLSDYGVCGDSGSYVLLHDNGYYPDMCDGEELTQHLDFETTELPVDVCGDFVGYSLLHYDGYPDILGEREKLSQHSDYETTDASGDASCHYGRVQEINVKASKMIGDTLVFCVCPQGQCVFKIDPITFLVSWDSCDYDRHLSYGTFVETRDEVVNCCHYPNCKCSSNTHEAADLSIGNSCCGQEYSYCRFGYGVFDSFCDSCGCQIEKRCVVLQSCLKIYNSLDASHTCLVYKPLEFFHPYQICKWVEVDDVLEIWNHLGTFVKTRDEILDRCHSPNSKRSNTYEADLSAAGHSCSGCCQIRKRVGVLQCLKIYNMVQLLADYPTCQLLVTYEMDSSGICRWLGSCKAEGTSYDNSSDFQI
eukprot:scaffold6358_cov80-Cylindrotheca_fusiformis.AAC.5